MGGRNNLFLIIFAILIIIGFIYIRDMKELTIKTKMQTTDWMGLGLTILVILGLGYFYGSRWEHYVMIVMVAILSVLAFGKRGVTPDGFSTRHGILRRGNWDNIKTVRIYTKEEDIKVEVRIGFSFDVHYYARKDSGKLMAMIKANLDDEMITIV